MMELIDQQRSGDTSKNFDSAISKKSAALAASQERSMEKVLKLDIGFIDTHPGSILSAFLLDQHQPFMSIDSVENIFNKLNKDIKNSILGEQLQSRIKLRKDSQVNRQAPDFTAEDTAGRMVRLSDFTGHYVLLDFWASWCVPCRQITPEIQEIYQLFQPKLKVIYISLDTNKDAWKKAIQEDNIGGKVNLWENRTGRQKETDVTYIYNVQPIPAFVLIDDKGKIIYRGESTSAAAEVKKILGTNLK
jgi:thiol-disulfide isomerase/thioredoxin